MKPACLTGARLRGGLALVLPALLIVACSTDGTLAQRPGSGRASSGDIQVAEISPQTLRRLQGRSMQPIRDRELNVRAACAFKDVNGGSGRLDLWVERGEVKRLSAEIDIPGHGVCRFDLPSFVQTATYPNVEMRSKANACLVRMWEQNEGVTVAFHDCRASCGGDAFDYLWPILVNPRQGSCA